jgi:PTH1 family peptidyl-tRNA hydrolase
LVTAVVGLGNPGPEYRNTRHNIGHRVLDHLARRLHAAWRRDARTLHAQAEWQGEPLALVKPVAFMNESGPVVAAALRRLHAGPEDLILVYDDIDLPLGTVRVRMKGSHGGHNGVRSVLETLRTSDVRRVKVGIGRPGTKDEVVDHVLSEFDADERAAVQAAVDEAAERVLSLVTTPAAPRGGAA